MKHQENFKALKAELKQLQQEKTKAVNNKEYEIAAQIRDKEQAIIKRLVQIRPPDSQLQTLQENIATIYNTTPIYELDKAVFKTNILIAEYALKVGSDYLIRGTELSTLIRFSTKKANLEKEHRSIISEHLVEWITVMEEIPLDDFDNNAVEVKIKNLIEFRYEQLRKLIKRERK